MQLNQTAFILSAFLLLISCASNKNIVDETRYDEDSTKHILSYQGKKKELVKEVSFYPNGNLKSEYNFSDSSLYGIFRIFNENGKPAKEGSYVNNIENGLFKYYDVNGVLTFEGYLNNGKKEGVWTTWYDEVQMQEQREYKNDVLHGKWTHWYIDGNLMKDEFYENGKKINEKSYD